MKKLVTTILTALVAGHFTLAPAAFAADDKKPTPQQQRMKDCNAEAKGMKGQERKDFMKQCLSGKQAERKEARSAQQDKMKTCNADAKAKGLKGDERKAFMSDCLKN
jgi:hypothetical protein